MARAAFFKHKPASFAFSIVIFLIIMTPGINLAQAPSQTPLTRLNLGIQAYMNGAYGDAISQFKSVLSSPNLSKEIQESGYAYLIASLLQIQQEQEASKTVVNALEAKIAFTDTVNFAPSVRSFIRKEVGQSLGILKITSEPYSATVRVDGNEIGSTPATISLPPGKHIVLVGKKSMITELRKGQQKEVAFKVTVPEGMPYGPSIGFETGSWNSPQGRSDFLALGRIGLSLARFTTSPIVSKMQIEAVAGGHYIPGILPPRYLVGIILSYHIIENQETPLHVYFLGGGSKDAYGYDPTTGQNKVAPDGFSQVELGAGLELQIKKKIPIDLYFEQGAMAILSGTSLADKAMVTKFGLKVSRP